MACGSTWNQGNKAPDSIAGERRVDRRYPILLDLRWKLIQRKRVLDAGEGNTVDLSSSGVRFESGRAMPDGLDVELAISWPVLLHNIAPMQLVVHGRIVRSQGSQIAIRMIQHEFRTRGVSANHCATPSTTGRTHTSFQAAVNGTSGSTKVQ